MTIALFQGAGVIPPITMNHRLRIAREFVQMDQGAFSAHTGMSRTTISGAENGLTVPSRKTLILWSMATGVSLDWLVKGETPPAVTAEGEEEECTPPDLNREPTDYGFDRPVIYLAERAA